MIKKRELTPIEKFLDEYNIDPLVFISIFIIFLVLICLPVYFVKSSDAKIEGHLIGISARVSGQIIQSYVTKDQEVKKGDVLFEIDSQEYQIEMMKARNDLAICKLKRKILKNEPIDANDTQSILTDNEPSKVKTLSRYRTGENNYSQYSKAYEQEDLKAKPVDPKQAELLTDVASKKSFQDLANPKSKQAPPSAKEVDTDLQSLGDIISHPEKIDVSHDTIDSVETQIKVLQSQIAELQLKLSYSRVCAPKDGVIASVTAEQGYFVETKEPLCTMIPKQVWITANFSSDDISKVQVGQPVRVKIPGYRTRLFKGVVSSIDTIEVQEAQQGEIEVTKDSMTMEQPEIKKITNVKIDFIEDYSDFNLSPGTNVLAIVKVK